MIKTIIKIKVKSLLLIFESLSSGCVMGSVKFLPIRFVVVSIRIIIVNFESKRNETNWYMFNTVKHNNHS